MEGIVSSPSPDASPCEAANGDHRQVSNLISPTSPAGMNNRRLLQLYPPLREEQCVLLSSAWLSRLATGCAG